MNGLMEEVWDSEALNKAGEEVSRELSSLMEAAKHAADEERAKQVEKEEKDVQE